MDRGPQISIKVDAKTCQALFASLLSSPSQAILPLATELQDEYGRFNLWTASMAVFAPDEACLDFRLKDVPEASELFVKQLSILETRMEQLREQLDPGHLQPDSQPDSSPQDVDMQLEPWDIKDIIHSIHETNDWLHRLSNLVRMASVTTQNQKAAAFVLRDEMGTDVTESLLCFYKAIIKRDCKDLGETLVDRMAQTMILRRKRILYRRTRQRYWTLKQTEDTRSKLDVLPVLPTQQDQGHGIPQEEEESRYDTDTEPLPNVKNRQTSSMLTAIVVDRDKYLKQAARSRISRATSAPFQPSERLLVPPRPRVAEKVGEFVCDYCCLILPSAQASDRERWAKHVKKDLDPYICVFDHCTEPHQLYSSNEEWLAHMSSQHRTRWHCGAKDHLPVSMESREQFIMHMEEVHPGRFRKEQLGFIADSCARPLAPTIPNCPFCSESAANLDAHVGQHLHYFALQSLPWPEHTVQDAEFASSYPSDDDSTSEWLDRATLRDTFDDIPSTTFIGTHTVVGNDAFLDDPPLLDHPVIFPVIERSFPEVDETLEKFKAAKRANNLDQSANPELVKEDIAGNYDHTNDSPIITADHGPLDHSQDYRFPSLDDPIWPSIYPSPPRPRNLLLDLPLATDSMAPDSWLPPDSEQIDIILPTSREGMRRINDLVETSHVREMKACLRCRMVKSKCDPYLVCLACSKQPCPESACIRTSLRDMLPIDYTRWHWNVPIFIGPEAEDFDEGRTLFYVSCSESLNSPCLEVIAAFLAIPNQDAQGQPEIRQWGIVPGEHPSETSICEWMERQILAESTPNFETEMDKLLCKFSRRLQDMPPDTQGTSLPATSLSNLRKMRCLWKLWSSDKLYIRQRPDSRGLLCDSQWKSIWDSLCIRATESISDFERKVISDCEEYLVVKRVGFRPAKETGSIGEVKIWLMLWQIMLIYRQTLNVIVEQQPRLPLTLNPPQISQDLFLRTNRELLGTISIIYSLVFRSRSTIEGVRETGFEFFDTDLRETYQEVWETFPSFCDQVEDRPLPTDEVFMAYIIKNERRILRVQAEDAFRTGTNPVPALQPHEQQSSLPHSSSTTDPGTPELQDPVRGPGQGGVTAKPTMRSGGSEAGAGPVGAIYNTGATQAVRRR